MRHFGTPWQITNWARQFGSPGPGEASGAHLGPVQQLQLNPDAALEDCAGSLCLSLAPAGSRAKWPADPLVSTVSMIRQDAVEEPRSQTRSDRARCACAAPMWRPGRTCGVGLTTLRGGLTPGTVTQPLHLRVRAGHTEVPTPHRLSSPGCQAGGRGRLDCWRGSSNPACGERFRVCPRSSTISLPAS
jgi:hypothetical protein